MGRMADLLRRAERGNGDHYSTLVAATTPIEVEEVVVAVVAEPEIEDESDASIPFIEVGDPRAPGTRLLDPRREVVQQPIALARPPVSEPLQPGLFTIRFQPVHAGKLHGRAFGPELVAYHQPEHAVSVQYRSLVAEIVTQLPGSQPRTLMFTAAAPLAGASTVLLNLAVTLARQDATRVVVVDAHVDRPALATKLGLSPKPGLREVLSRQTPLAWSLQESAQPNLLALTAGQATTPWNGSEFPGVIELLRARADWVLVDAGGWDGSEAAPAVAESCDAVYLVLRQQMLDTPETAKLQAAILDATGRLRGCVITQS